MSVKTPKRTATNVTFTIFEAQKNMENNFKWFKIKIYSFISHSKLKIIQIGKCITKNFKVFQKSMFFQFFVVGKSLECTDILSERTSFNDASWYIHGHALHIESQVHCTMYCVSDFFFM